MLDEYSAQLTDLQKKVNESSRVNGGSTSSTNELQNVKNGKDLIPAINQNPFLAEDASLHVHNHSSK